jgi:hypothetical protein
LNHGEDQARETLRRLLRDKGLDAERIYMPQFDETFELRPGTGPLSKGAPKPRLDVSRVAHDWHNDYAEFMLGLTAALDEASDAERAELLQQLKTVLQSGQAAAK